MQTSCLPICNLKIIMTQRQYVLCFEFYQTFSQEPRVTYMFMLRYRSQKKAPGIQDLLTWVVGENHVIWFVGFKLVIILW